MGRLSSILCKRQERRGRILRMDDIIIINKEMGEI